MDFLGTDPPVKLELVDLFTGSWDLALLDSVEPPRVTKKQVAIAEVKMISFLLFLLHFLFLTNLLCWSIFLQAFARALKVVRSTPSPSLL